MFDSVLAFCRIIATSVSPVSKAVLANLSGPASSLDPKQGEADVGSETASKQRWYSAPGVITRPPPPSKVDGKMVDLEAIAARTGDGLVPFTYRDLRLNRLYPAPKEGSITHVGYGGAFDSNEATLDGDGNPVSSIRTTYVPYAFVDGVPTKALAIVVDGTDGNESISIVHGDGMAITMKHGGKNSVTIKNKAGDAYVEVNDDGITANGNTVVNGGMTVGSPTAAVPVALAPQLATYLGALTSAIATALGGVPVAGAGLASAFTATMTTSAPVLASVPATKSSAL